MARTADEAIYLILHLGDAMAQAETLDDLYEAIGFGADLAYQLYPHIDCHTGCNRCCKDNSLPIVSPLEWQRVYEAVLALPDTAREELIARTLAWQERLGTELWTLHDLLHTNASMAQVEQISVVLESFQNTSCPFIVMDRCGIYDNRPSKCRAHGAYLIRFGDMVQMHTCAEEVDKMEAYLANQGSRRVAMPYWNPAEQRLSALNQPGYRSAVLPLWLLAHIEDGQFRPEAMLAPDWAAVKARYQPTV